MREFKKSEVLRYLGYMGGEVTDDISNLIDSCMEELTEKTRPQYVYDTFCICAKTDDNITLENCPLELSGQNMQKLLSDCGECAVFAATLGIEADNLIRITQAADMARSVVLDACAVEYIEMICDDVQDKIRKEAETNGFIITPRFSPGYGDLPLTVQKDLLASLDAARKCGITLTKNYLMIPRKSVTAVIGLRRKP